MGYSKLRMYYVEHFPDEITDCDHDNIDVNVMYKSRHYYFVMA